MPNSHFVVRDNVKLHHLDWGNEGAHPIVLAHGGRLHARVWNDFGRRFSDRYHVVAVDHRGHGDSGWAPREQYQLEEYYRDLAAVVKARGLKKFTLIGHSLGGMTSMLYAHRHPETLARLVLVDITAGRPAAPPGTDFSRVAETPSPREFESVQAAAKYLSNLMVLSPPEMIEESAQHGLRQLPNGRYTWKYDPELVHGGGGRSSNIDFWKVVSEIQTPTLLQYGDRSKIATPELAQRMQQTMPRCTIECIERAGHGLFTDRPDAFADSVARFLASSGAG